MIGVLGLELCECCSPRPRRCAVARLTRATLSQVSRVSGRGNSISQPLFANRPSQTCGSGRKAISREDGGLTVEDGDGAVVVESRSSVLDPPSSRIVTCFACDA